MLPLPQVRYKMGRVSQPSSHIYGIGSLRFKAPALPATTPGVQQANANPSTCMQAGDGVAATTPFRVGQLQSRAADAGPSEDCLFLR